MPGPLCVVATLGFAMIIMRVSHCLLSAVLFILVLSRTACVVKNWVLPLCLCACVTGKPMIATGDHRTGPAAGKA